MAPSDGLSETLRRLLAAQTAQRPTARDATFRDFQPLAAPASAIPEDVRAYVARETGASRAAQPAVDSELAAAQESDAKRAFFRHTGSALDDAGRVIAGLPQAMNRAGGERDASVRGLMQQRGSADANAAAQAKATAAASRKDPNSPAARKLRQMIASAMPGMFPDELLAELTEDDAGNLMEFGKLRSSLDERRAAREQSAQEREASRALQEKLARERNIQSGENARTMAGISRERLDLARAEDAREAAQANKSAKGPNLPASEVAAYGGIDAATAMLDELAETRKKKAGSWYSGAAQYAPGTDAGEYADAQKAAAQTVGLILENGKLAEGDLARYMAMIPTAGDSDERAAAKTENIKRMLAIKKAAQFQALKDAGYNTGALTPSVAPVSVGGAQRGGNIDLAAEDSAAVKWARANPNDPRAAAILEANGVE